MSPPSKKVAVLGARGRMGTQVCSAVADAGGLELVAELDAGDPLQAIVDAGAEVVVDFTHPDVVMDNLAWCIDHGVDAVVGTSGFTEARLEQLSVMVGESAVAILIAPNFSIGAVLMMRMAEQAAPYFESVEIIELHHPDKVDAPSGTATRTAERIGTARDRAGCADVPDATTSDPDGARGATVSGVHIHAVRARGLVAHQEVILGGAGETLTIRHDSVDRDSFMPGVLAGVRGVSDHPGVTLGLDTILGLA